MKNINKLDVILTCAFTKDNSNNRTQWAKACKNFYKRKE
jgi:hypothetical protein